MDKFYVIAKNRKTGICSKIAYVVYDTIDKFVQFWFPDFHDDNKWRLERDERNLFSVNEIFDIIDEFYFYTCNVFETKHDCDVRIIDGWA